MIALQGGSRGIWVFWLMNLTRMMLLNNNASFSASLPVIPTGICVFSKNNPTEYPSYLYSCALYTFSYNNNMPHQAVLVANIKRL